VEQAVAEGAVRHLVVIDGVELVEAVPTKLVAALATLHELAALLADNIDFAGGAGHRTNQLVEVARVFAPIKTP